MSLNGSDLSRRIVATEDLQGLSDHERLAGRTNGARWINHCASLPSQATSLAGQVRGIKGGKGVRNEL